MEQEQPKTESSKGSVVRDQRWAEVQHCETHDCINDITTSGHNLTAALVPRLSVAKLIKISGSLMSMVE